MIGNNNLIPQIANEFGIKQGINEPSDRWKMRIVYSMLGQMACASMYDTADDDQPVSVVHFKSRIHDLLGSYFAIFPELQTQFDKDSAKLCDEIYSIYLSCGYIYHSAYRIAPAHYADARSGQILFTRSMAPGEKHFVSGLGTFTKGNEVEASQLSPQCMFQLPEHTLTGLYTHFISQAKWAELNTTEPIEYLRTDPPFSRGYWQNKESKIDGVQLARTGSNGNRTYYLYKEDGSTTLFSQVPAWLMDGPGYRRVSNSILAKLGTLPPFVYAIDGSITTMTIQYLPAEEELNFLKLYSWPTTCVGLPHDFTRIFDTDVFFAIKEVLEFIGYQFEEQENV